MELNVILEFVVQVYFLKVYNFQFGDKDFQNQNLQMCLRLAKYSTWTFIYHS